MSRTISNGGAARCARVGSDLADLAGWWWAAVVAMGRAAWDALPGPWYVKAALIVITQLIPGPQDELLLLAIVAVCRRLRAHRAHLAAERVATGSRAH
jgi:hypothetical protein